MPAYRSDAEAEVRGAVVERIRGERPNARIIHEINASGWGNRIDILAVETDEIIAVEIKSAKDKLTRLPAQIAAMKGAAHHVIVALHEKFLVEQQTNRSAAHYVRDGIHYLRRIPEDLRPGNSQVAFWIYPETRRAMNTDWHDSDAVWSMPRRRHELALPASAINMLWRDELRDLCGRLKVSAGRRATMAEMLGALTWYCNGRDLTLAVCDALRRRPCVEADPVVSGEFAA